MPASIFQAPQDPARDSARDPAREQREAHRARQVELILERVDALPTLSTVATRLIRVSSATDVEIDEIAKIIEVDPALSMRILGLCRRADRGLGDRITTVKRAVVMLGIEAVRAAALSVSVYDVMARDGDQQREQLDATISEGSSLAGTRGFDRTGFWKHSIGVAAASELIASAQKDLGVVPEEAFLAGLLHGIGRLALDLVLPKAYDRVVRLAEKRACSTTSLERELIGLDHHTAGKRVAAHWQLPAALQDVVWLHDQPAAALPAREAARLAAIVSAARALCRQVHLGWSGDFGPSPDVASAWRDLRISLDPQAIANKLHDAVTERMRLLGLDQSTTPQLLTESLASATRQLSRMTLAVQSQAGKAQARGRALEAVALFCDSCARASTLGDVLGTIVASAGDVLGPGFFAMLVREGERDPGASDPWTLHEFGPAGELRSSRDLESPGQSAVEDALRALSEGRLEISTLGVLHWLSEHLIDAPDVRRLRLAPVRTGGRSGVGLLVTDRSWDAGSPEAGPGEGHRALIAAWGSALGHACEQGRARRLHEQLVEAGRALTEAQAKLSEQEAMVRLGETTAGAAHEMNNPLTVIVGRSQLLLTRMRDERDKASVQAIASSANQLGDMIQGLHLLSQRPTVRAESCELKGLVLESIKQAQMRACADSRVTLDLAGAPPKLRVDPKLLKGALVELLANALEASPEEPIAVRALADLSQRRLSLTVVDGGQGLSLRAMQHAFDPFFSEKSAGRSRGLGLTKARVMAEALGGQIQLEPNQPKGTIATLWIREWMPLGLPDSTRAEVATKADAPTKTPSPALAKAGAKAPVDAKRGAAKVAKGDVAPAGAGGEGATPGDAPTPIKLPSGERREPGSLAA